jgi:sulfatase maturation enzyme AslB (radical SAM superfamily)
MNLVTLRDAALGWAGLKSKGITLVLEPVNACCCKCPSCSVSVLGARDGKKMTIETFRKVLDKLEREAGQVRVCHLYFKGEPTLNPDLHLFVEELTRRRIKSSVSTVLQTIKCDMRKLLAAGPSEFRVSFPGVNHIAKYQKGSPDRFLNNFYAVSVLPRHPKTRFVIFYQVYKTNQGFSMTHAKVMARQYGYDFIPVPAVHMVSEHIISREYTKAERELISDLIETPEESVARMDTRSRYCYAWKSITLDANADVYVCTLMYEDKYRIGNFLDTPLKELQRRQRAPVCNACMESGNNVYQACYEEFITHKDPVTGANRKRMK